MKKKNIIDLSAYKNGISDELKEAIQSLIMRLRNAEPLNSSPHRYPAQINKKAR